MDLTTNELYKQIKKKSKNNIIEDIKPSLPSISIKARLTQVNQPKKEENIEKYFTMIILNESNITNFIYNSSLNQKIILCFNHLEYLSITNNYLINLNFIINFPDLFYLDVYGNPLEDFDALNYKNIFGYLRLTVEKFHEKNILSIYGLNCSILDIDIKDKNVLRYFKINNPNIIMLNNEIMYYIDTLIEAETKRGTKKIKYIDRNSLINTSTSNDISASKNSNIDSNKINLILDFKTDKRNQNKHQSHKFNNIGFLRNQITTQLKQQTKPGNLKLNNNDTISIKINNKFLLEIKNFFEELNQIITKITKKAKGKLRSQDLYEEQTYLKIEKKRILLLYQTYMKLNVFNNRKKDEINDIYIKNIEAINANNFTDVIKIYEIKQYIKCININIRFGIIILISMLFYCLNLISMKMAITIIHYLLLKYYKFDEHKQFQYFNTFGNIHYLCYYLDNLEDYKTKLKFGEKSQIDLYQKILDILEVPKLFLKLNKLYQKKNFFSKAKNISQKRRVSTLLSDIKELKIEKEILILIEFFCDFIQYEDIEQKIINGSENDEYSTMIEIKEMLEQNELEKNNSYVQDLSVKKFYKTKLESTFNKFFFENDKIKMVKNKTFKDTNNNKKHFNRNKMNLISFFNKWNQEYKKYDDINTKNCFTVDKYITKAKINNIINKRLKNIKSSELYKENIDFSEEKNCLSIGNNLSKNILSNHNINIKQNINCKNERELYFKTENNDNFYYRLKSDRIKENKKMINDNQNSIGMFSTKNIFRKNNNPINKIMTQYQNNFKLFSNNSPDSKMNSNETNNKKLLRNFLLNKTLRQRTINKLKISEEKTYSLRIKKLKIKKGKEKETPYININAYRLYEKTKLNKTKKENKNFFNKDFLVEKYNQAKQSKIIRNILEKRNKLFQERLQKSKNFISTNKSNK